MKTKTHLWFSLKPLFVNRLCNRHKAWTNKHLFNICLNLERNRTECVTRPFMCSYFKTVLFSIIRTARSHFCPQSDHLFFTDWKNLRFLVSTVLPGWQTQNRLQNPRSIPLTLASNDFIKETCNRYYSYGYSIIATFCKSF